MNLTTVILAGASGELTFSDQLVTVLPRPAEPPHAGNGSMLFSWHGGSRDALLAASLVKLIDDSGELRYQGRLDPARQPHLRGDRRLEFGLLVGAEARAS